MSALSVLFDKKIDQRSPVQVDLYRVVNVDSEGNEHITFSKVDYPKLQQSNGVAEDWCLRSLLKAGISPDFSIHTGSPTRLELESQLDSIREQINTLFPEEVTVSSGNEDPNAE